MNLFQLLDMSIYLVTFGRAKTHLQDWASKRERERLQSLQRNLREKQATSRVKKDADLEKKIRERENGAVTLAEMLLAQNVGALANAEKQIPQLIKILEQITRIRNPGEVHAIKEQFRRRAEAVAAAIEKSNKLGKELTKLQVQIAELEHHQHGVITALRTELDNARSSGAMGPRHFAIENWFRIHSADIQRFEQEQAKLMNEMSPLAVTVPKLAQEIKSMMDAIIDAVESNPSEAVQHLYQALENSRKERITLQHMREVIPRSEAELNRLTAALADVARIPP